MCLRQHEKEELLVAFETEIDKEEAARLNHIKNFNEARQNAESAEELERLMGFVIRSDVHIRKLREAHNRALSFEDIDVCIECGEEIPVARLLDQPSTQHCVDCKADEEYRYKRERGCRPGTHALLEALSS